MSGVASTVRAAHYIAIALLACGPGALVGAHWASAATVAARPSAGCRAESLEHSRELHRTIDVGGVQRSYILDVPERVQPHAPVPLLFDFHGFGHSAAGLWRVSGFHELAARDGFITVYPDGLPVHLLGREAPGWEIFTTAGNRDLALTATLLDRLEADYCIDEARVFATGFSNGAFFTHLLGCTMADRFAAIAPVSGGLITTPCAPARGVPVLIHHGRRDALIEVQRGRNARDAWIEKDQCNEPSEKTAREGMRTPREEQASNGCEWHHHCRDGAEVEYCEDDGEHRWPVEATERIWNFFRDHPMPKRGDPGAPAPR
jgi:polyhydroxybutyrate depolymerase